ncbi:dTDP-4-dehydrorhamnose 3,5-epimerase [Desulfosudis oleivorans]|uniref:dTDP-4-dehydrorhamnose 3,5-epimerase n=1 Tax=Desulfosudis oleivorans (strain DSM 6200 / JCM 39069 / Hxd3) TaxID=96561 RepID=A8ZWW6_DESOH|nr:dTDP-4-dehydrorhamnose 3,5-epimerase [Desulfosudis oleivorans]ABW66822.1 dTDP-4-dehydrorhamnose 3,5-epimerase [Desulfosudis oleivorans Hxd3]
MRVVDTDITGVRIIEPDVFEDARGFFMETYQRQRYAGYGVDVDFVQDNLSFSSAGTLRGLHYQYPFAQEKLVHVISGEIYDVAVDVRRGSPTFGRWVGTALSSANRRQFFIPKGFAHGFLVVSDTALVTYKCGDYYHPEADRTLRWDDPALIIDWGTKTPLLSPKDAAAPSLKDIPSGYLPVYGEFK